MTDPINRKAEGRELFGNSEQLEKDHFADPGKMVGDLISRQAAIDEIRKCRFVVDAIEKIKGLPSAQYWIPCSERLPETSGQYYVSGGGKVWICEFLIISTPIGGRIGGWCNNAANPIVQAWMPLPEAWKGEEHGTSRAVLSQKPVR